ncbi:MAG: PTS sugar transporter subunit IIA [Spirochaetia bacterium]|nr:PTS sugar transporter subunit IIA [Spirochaetia bacterium]
MKLFQLLTPETIITNWPDTVSVKNKWKIIEYLVDLLVLNKNIPKDKKSEIIRLVKEREISMTTGIGDGIAIPHASADFIEEETASMAVLPSGINFEAIDHKKVYIIVLVLIPKNDFQRHIRVLSGITRALHYEDMIKTLLSAKNSKEALNIIKKNDEDY